jgi:hypothetical protein
VTSFGESYLRVRHSSHSRRTSLPIPIRTRIRAHIRRDPQRRNWFNVPSHPRQQPPLLNHRHLPSLQRAHPRMSCSSLPSYHSSPGLGPYPYGQQYPGLLPTPPVYPGQLQQQQAPPPPYGRGVGGREEIILVSDDHVLTLRMALPGQ